MQKVQPEAEAVPFNDPTGTPVKSKHIETAASNQTCKVQKFQSYWLTSCRKPEAITNKAATFSLQQKEEGKSLHPQLPLGFKYTQSAEINHLNS